jgi:hypothetical protein
MLRRSTLSRWLPWGECAGFVAAASALVAVEVSRHPEYVEQPSSLLSFTPDLESTWLGLAVLAGQWTEDQLGFLVWMTWPGLVLIAAPLFWWIVRARRRSMAPEPAAEHHFPAPTRSNRWVWVLAPGMFALAVSSTAWIGQSFAGLPPAYHDEYSYIFQAKTFLSGHLYMPSDARTQFFSQMHVLNDNGVFASRYFPGVGLWLAPSVAIGRLYWSHYLAGGLVVALVFLIGCELPRIGFVAGEAGGETDAVAEVDVTTGVLAALMCALSPALLIFGNLLLSHHPTMLGLIGFVFCYFRALRSESIVWPLLGGSSLCLAMLCRPLSAFGFALPFGVHALVLVWRGTLHRAAVRLAAAAAPIVLGIAGLAGYNAALTGNPFESPYGLYTRTYTPSHCYGFHNVTRGKAHIGPKIVQNYDQWAEELTLPRAFRLLLQRADASSSWSIGRLTIAWLAGVVAVVIWRLPTPWRLLAAAIVGLHAAYFPYGFEGIFGLSYVFETIPVLCLLAAGIAVWLVREWRTAGRIGRVAWLCIFLAINLSDPLMHLLRGISEVRFPRQYYADFEQRLAASGVRPPALIGIRANPKDRHRDLVVNSPSLDDSILRARIVNASQVPELMALYPEREVWLFDAESETLAAVKGK